MAERLLVFAPLVFWFSVGFPWSHHNESLVWELALKRVSLWEALSTNPIPAVLTYRPLGTALAWLTFRASGGELWPQQLVNLGFSCAAWLLAARTGRRQRSLSWVGLLCTGGFFSGYIYLFHLHGVFYGPLLLWVAWLSRRSEDNRRVSGVGDVKERSRSSKSLLLLAAFAAFAGLVHTYALALACAVLVGEWFERPARLTASRTLMTAGLVVAMLFAAWLLTPAASRAQYLTVQQVLTAFRALELHPALQVLSGLLALACVSGLVAPSQPATRAFALGTCALAALGCMLTKVPVLLVWVCACVLTSLTQRRFGHAALIAATAAFPAATGTGSPVYAVFLVLPCAVATADTLETRLPATLPSWLAPAVFTALALVGLMLRMQVPLPIVGRLAKPLQAEREKTMQMAHAFDWLDAQPQLTGNLKLCTPANTPSNSAGAVDRTIRAPTFQSYFREYVQVRYANRLSHAGKTLLLCFGGQSIAGARPLWTLSGGSAGASTLFEADSRMQQASAHAR